MAVVAGSGSLSAKNHVSFAKITDMYDSEGSEFSKVAQTVRSTCDSRRPYTAPYGEMTPRNRTYR